MRTFWDRILGAGSLAFNHRVSEVPVPTASPTSVDQFYDLMDGYYYNNKLYDELKRQMVENNIWTPAAKGLRNPCYRDVEFYVAKVWPGPLARPTDPDSGSLAILTENPAIVTPIHQVWGWSGWESKKQVFIRWGAIYGETFIKVVRDNERRQVFFQYPHPKIVTSFEHDDRGNLRYIRIDKKVIETIGVTEREYTHTEVWEKLPGSEGVIMKLWLHDKQEREDLAKLGTPSKVQTTRELGFDFVPFVHVKWRDMGEKHGLGSYALQLDKIDEINRSTTRLHQMLFRWGRPYMALESDPQPGQRNKPGPIIRNEDEDIRPRSRKQAAAETVELGEDRVMSLPPGSKLTFTVPNLPYEQMLAVIRDDMMELEQDLPTLKYGRLRDIGGQPSGRAVRLLLSDAVDKVIEVRPNQFDGLMKANQMALSLGAAIKLWPADGEGGIGTFTNTQTGSFAHTFRETEIIPLTGMEAAEEEETDVRAKTGKVALGVPREVAITELGYESADATRFAGDYEEEQTRVSEEALRRFAGGEL